MFFPRSRYQISSSDRLFPFCPLVSLAPICLSYIASGRLYANVKYSCNMLSKVTYPVDSPMVIRISDLLNRIDLKNSIVKNISD